MKTLMLNLLVETTKEVAITKQDVLPASGLGVTIGAWKITQSEVAAAISILIAIFILVHKIFQIYVLYHQHKRDQELHEERHESQALHNSGTRTP